MFSKSLYKLKHLKTRTFLYCAWVKCKTPQPVSFPSAVYLLSTLWNIVLMLRKGTEFFFGTKTRFGCCCRWQKKSKIAKASKHLPRLGNVPKWIQGDIGPFQETVSCWWCSKPTQKVQPHNNNKNEIKLKYGTKMRHPFPLYITETGHLSTLESVFKKYPISLTKTRSKCWRKTKAKREKKVFSKESVSVNKA